MAAMVAAMWDQPSGLEIHSPGIAKPAESGPCIPVGAGKSTSGKLVFPHLSVFCKSFLATGGVLPISGQLGGLLAT